MKGREDAKQKQSLTCSLAVDFFSTPITMILLPAAKNQRIGNLVSMKWRPYLSQRQLWFPSELLLVHIRRLLASAARRAPPLSSLRRARPIRRPQLQACHRFLAMVPRRTSRLQVFRLNHPGKRQRRAAIGMLDILPFLSSVNEGCHQQLWFILSCFS